MKPTISKLKHQTLFPLQEILDLEPETKLEKILAEINIKPVVRVLRNTGRGANGYKKSNIVRALIARQIEQIPNMTALYKRLDEDIKFADTCGYKITEPIPSLDTLCRCFRKLAETEALARITQDLTAKTKELDMIDSEKVALDSSKLESYDSPRPSSQIDKDDPDRADWGAKQDSQKNIINWYGYKFHVVCDTSGEIILAFKLSPANESDSEHALSLIEEAVTELPEMPSYYLMDKGYDEGYL